MEIVLRPHTFLAAVTASGETPWVLVDFKYSGEQTRSVFGSRVDVDSPITVLTKISVPTYGSDGKIIDPVEVTSTVTTFVSGNGTYFSTEITRPVTHIKVIKANSSGAATIVGII